jgi:hypothetical protein
MLQRNNSAFFAAALKRQFSGNIYHELRRKGECFGSERVCGGAARIGKIF